MLNSRPSWQLHRPARRTVLFIHRFRRSWTNAWAKRIDDRLFSRRFSSWEISDGFENDTNGRRRLNSRSWNSRRQHRRCSSHRITTIQIEMHISQVSPVWETHPSCRPKVNLSFNNSPLHVRNSFVELFYLFYNHVRRSHFAKTGQIRRELIDDQCYYAQLAQLALVLNEIFDLVLNYRCDNEITVPSIALKKCPSKRLYPVYYEIISRPIDLSMMRNRIDQGEYSSFESFEEDFLLLIQNAIVSRSLRIVVHHSFLVLSALLRWRFWCGAGRARIEELLSTNDQNGICADIESFHLHAGGADNASEHHDLRRFHHASARTRSTWRTDTWDPVRYYL